MITAIALDDEPLALNVIEAFCAKTEGIDLVKTFTKPHEALEYLQKFPVDLIFLDIHIPSLTGIELAKQIKQNTLVVFCTAHSQYAVEGFNLNALDYLLKPFTYNRFEQSVQKAKDYLNTSASSAFMFVRADYSLQKIVLADILYIEALDDYLKIIIPGQKTIVTRMTMKTMIEKLPQDQFIRCHRSFVVPVKKIEAVKNKHIIIGTNQIPIGNTYEESVLMLLK